MPELIDGGRREFLALALSLLFFVCSRQGTRKISTHRWTANLWCNLLNKKNTHTYRHKNVIASKRKDEEALHSVGGVVVVFWA